MRDKINSDKGNIKSNMGLNICCMLIALLIGIWPLVVFAGRVKYGFISGYGDLSQFLDLNYTLLLPVLGSIALLIWLSNLPFMVSGRISSLARKVSTAAFSALIGCVIAYGFLYLFDKKMNWRESHTSINPHFLPWL
ncbi:MAG: hypothetical protein M3347_09230, partial [Armatimonadota bacterium]|nr:hypothetical protein [Armatimonadota bacterium]